MTSHVGLMALFALFVSVVFATLQRDFVREQIPYAARLFVAFMGVGVLVGWVLYLLPL